MSKVILNNTIIEADKPYDLRDQTVKDIPFKGACNTMLYVGARGIHGGSNLRFLTRHFNLKEVTLLEIWKPNIEVLHKHLPTHEIIEADFVEFVKTTEKKWDMVVWWHGPEHVALQQCHDTLENMKKLATKIIILGCPYGLSYPQGTIEGNVYEKHRSFPIPSVFHEHGYNTHSILLPGGKEGAGCHITAWLLK